MDKLSDIKPAPDSTLKVYLFCGAIVLIFLWAYIWYNGSGMMSDAGSGRRWLAWVGACAFGFGLGWLLFPRRIPAFWRDEDDH